MSVGTNDPHTSQNTYTGSPDGVGVYGQSVVDHGLVVGNQINGIGLLSDGLCWQFGEIWLDPGSIDDLSTSWDDSSDLTTVAAQAFTTFTRANNLGGAISIPGDAVFESADGPRFAPLSGAGNDLTFGQPSYFFPTTNPANATIGDVYQDSLGHQYTVTQTEVDHPIPMTGTYRPYPFTAGVYPTPIGTLTRVSGSGDATISYWQVTASDFEVYLSLEALIPGPDGNVTAGTMTSVDALGDPLIAITNLAGSGGAGTAWTDISAVTTAWTPSFGPEFLV